MRRPDWLKTMAGAPGKILADGTRLRLLTAREVLEARREALDLAGDGGEQALCSNACLVARTVVDRRGRPVYPSGQAVLERCTPGDIQHLAKEWADFDREENPGLSTDRERVERLKKAWSACRGSAFGGMCCEALGRCRRRSGPNA